MTYRRRASRGGSSSRSVVLPPPLAGEGRGGGTLPNPYLPGPPPNPLPRRATVLALTLLALGSIGCSTMDVTGARVRVYDTSGLDQLVFSARAAGLVALAPTARPDPPVIMEEAEESVVLVLPRLLAEEDLTVRVEGRLEGTLVRVGAVVGRLVVGEIIELEVELVEPPTCGDGRVSEPLEECDDGDLDAGDGCSPECTIEPGWTCAHTGRGPSVCAPVPDAGPSANDAGPAPCDCESGQRCVEGACVCDTTSCPEGCCAADRCRVESASTCGRGGESCSDCQADARADRCVHGVCRCGSESRCRGRERCLDQECDDD